MNTFQKTAATMNKLVVALLRLPGVGGALKKSTVMLTYTGRKSGTTFSLPVSYKQKGDVVTIRVALPDKKNWWRNFQGAGDKVTLDLRGVTRTGHAVTTRDDSGRVTVTVTLEPQAR